MKLKLIISSFVTLILCGCATQQPQSVWFKSGATQQDFEIDRGQCNAQAFSVANGNLYQIAIVQNQCLQGKGWQLVNPHHITNSNNELTEERERLKRESERLCSLPQYSVIYSKTPCFSNQIDFKYMTDDSKITTAQKQVFINWRKEIDVNIQKSASLESRLNGSLGKKYSNYSLSIMKNDNDKNNLDLYNGSITWGQYNSRRKEIYTKMIDAMK